LSKDLTSGCGGLYRSRLSHRTVPHPTQVLTDTENPPPVPLDATHAAALRTLQDQPAGPAFDRAYVLSQLQQHQALLLVQQGYLDSFNRSADTQHIAVLARMSIQQHLVMLQEIQSMLA
jgi:putative membrane protein